MTHKSRLITVAGAKVIFAVAILHISKLSKQSDKFFLFFPQCASGWNSPNNVPFSPPTLNTLPAFSNYFYSASRNGKNFSILVREPGRICYKTGLFSLLFFSPKTLFAHTFVLGVSLFPSILKQPPRP